MKMEQVTGKKRALVAVAHRLVVTGYHLITRHQDYYDLGPNHFDQRHKGAVVRRTIRRLAQLGFQVELKPVLDHPA
jgi:transposase